MSKNVMAVVALVLAIIGLVTFWIPILGALLSIVGLVLAIIALMKAKNYPPLTARKGMSIAAVGISAIGTLLGLFITFIMIYVASVASECFTTIADPTAQAQCVQEKINSMAN